MHSALMLTVIHQILHDLHRTPRSRRVTNTKGFGIQQYVLYKISRTQTESLLILGVMFSCVPFALVCPNESFPTHRDVCIQFI